MIFVDTGFLIALIDTGDALHSRAKSWFTIRDQPYLLTEHVLLEMMNYFSSPQARPRAYALGQLLPSDERCDVQLSTPQLFDARTALYRDHHDKSWSLTDCISFHLMREREINQALAYDHHFEQAGFEALLRRDPH